MDNMMELSVSPLNPQSLEFKMSEAGGVQFEQGEDDLSYGGYGNSSPYMAGDRIPYWDRQNLPPNYTAGDRIPYQDSGGQGLSINDRIAASVGIPNPNVSPNGTPRAAPRDASQDPSWWNDVLESAPDPNQSYADPQYGGISGRILNESDVDPSLLAPPPQAPPPQAPPPQLGGGGGGGGTNPMVQLLSMDKGTNRTVASPQQALATALRGGSKG